MGNEYVTFKQVKKAAEQAMLVGEKPTPEKVQELLGGIGEHDLIARHLKKWKQYTSSTPDGSQSGDNDVLQSRNAELKKSLALTRATLESTGDAILVLDRLGRFVDWNQKLLEFAKLPEEVLEAGNERKALQFLTEQIADPKELMETVKRLQEDRTEQGDIGEVKMRDGRIFERYTQPFKMNDQIAGRVFSFRDITERRKAEEELRLRERAIESSTQGVVIMENTPEFTVRYVNPAFTTITGYLYDDIVSNSIMQLFAKEKGQPEVESLKLAQKECRGEEVVLRSHKKDGLLFWNEMHLAPVPNPDGEVTHMVAIINDITDRKAMEEQLLHQATHDILTDLPNRALLQDRITQAILHAKRDKTCAGVIFLDLDNFKVINDSLGHKMGDSLLKAVARRLRQSLRSTDTVARIGGDEFVITLSPLRVSEDSIAIAQKLLKALRRPFQVEERELNITGSIGISCYPKDGFDADTLIRNADTAMYRAKDLGRDTFQFFTKEMNEIVSQRMAVGNNLRRALEREEFFLEYQPLVSIKGGVDKIVGFESLLRWENEAMGGRVSPMEFVPLAEDLGLIVPIGSWVLEESCRQAKTWVDMGLDDIQISVNLSSRQLAQEDIVDVVAKALKKTQLPAKHLVLELTETVLMDNTHENFEKLDKLKDMGVRLAIDDFGTGYSSLAYLRRLPVDKIKIDKAFVDDIGNDDNAEAINMAIIALSQGMNLKVVAEGVETLDQLEFLRKYNCDEIQGYYFSKPVPADKSTKLLKENRGIK